MPPATPARRTPATDTIEAVIPCRGSTRRFARQSISGGALGWAMTAATRAVPGDFVPPGATLLEHFLAVHAVQGLPPGAYRWREGGVAAERLQLAAFALGVGATGLTFLDDDVSAFFGTPAAPMLTVAVGIPAHRARPGRRPTQLPHIGVAER